MNYIFYCPSHFCRYKHSVMYGDTKETQVICFGCKVKIKLGNVTVYNDDTGDIIELKEEKA